MNLGKLCKHSADCHVYQNKNKELNKPLFLIRNVYCNRGYKGWSNCKRYVLLEQGLEADEKMTPYD